jgi:hypothetical protein
MVDFDGDWDAEDLGDMDLDLGDMDLEIEDTEDTDAGKKSTTTSSWKKPTETSEKSDGPVSAKDAGAELFPELGTEPVKPAGNTQRV